MCGRYYIDDSAYSEIRKLVRDIEQHHSNAQIKCGDIHPSESALIITRGNTQYTPGRNMELAAEIMDWGFPGYQGKGIIINARAETVLQKKTFRDSVLHRRCLIPARHFYEWDTAKNKATCRRFDSSVIYMAGFYYTFQGRKRFVIITTEANESVKKIHERMPLILEQKELENWLYDDSSLDFLLHKVPVMLESEQEYEQMTLPFM